DFRPHHLYDAPDAGLSQKLTASARRLPMFSVTDPFSPKGRHMQAILPLGDAAVIAYFGDEPGALRFAASVRRARLNWIEDVVSAYTSVAVFLSLDRTDFATATAALRELDMTQMPGLEEGRVHALPCCYELALDMDRVQQQTGLDSDAIVRLHA